MSISKTDYTWQKTSQITEPEDENYLEIKTRFEKAQTQQWGDLGSEGISFYSLVKILRAVEGFKCTNVQFRQMKTLLDPSNDGFVKWDQFESFYFEIEDRNAISDSLTREELIERLQNTTNELRK